ncbi:unnamed protein product [Discosporangium mesarthrocarpum]
MDVEGPPLDPEGALDDHVASDAQEALGSGEGAGSGYGAGSGSDAVPLEVLNSPVGNRSAGGGGLGGPEALLGDGVGSPRSESGAGVTGGASLKRQLSVERRRLDSECGEGSGVGSGAVSGSGGGSRIKRRRREGSGDTSGQKECAFQLTSEEQGEFFERIRDLYEQQLLCDITLSVGGTEFMAHKAVLACSRTFLGAMMTTGGGMKEGTQDVIELKEIQPKEFKMLLDYMYAKPIKVPSGEVIDLLGLATRYQVDGLKTQLCSVLAENISYDNACSVYAAAEAFLCEEVKAKAFARIASHFALATKSDGWTALTEGQLLQILSSDQVLDCDESVVFDAASRWLQAYNGCRMASAPQVLSMVRFPLMDAGLLSDVIKTHTVTQASQDSRCQALISEAYEHQALKAVGRPGLTSSRRTKPRRRSCSFKKHMLLTEHSDAVSALAVMKSKLVSGSWDTNIKASASTHRVWDTKTWSCDRTLSDHAGTIRCFEILDDSQWLLSGSDDGSIKVWNTETWGLVRTLDDHSDAVNAIEECAGRVASGSDDGTIKLWNTSTWQCEVTIHQADETRGVLALATCGDFLVSGSDGSGMKVWNTHNWTCEKSIMGHGDEIWTMAVIGGKLVSGSIDSTIRVWDTATWTCERVLEDHGGPVYALTVLEGKLVSASSDHTIRVWGPDWGCDRVLECGGVWSLTVYNDRLVSGSLDNAVKVWGV